MPLITEYTTKVTRVLRVLAVARDDPADRLGDRSSSFAQQSLFDWVGDRIDNLTDENAAGATAVQTDQR